MEKALAGNLYPFQVFNFSRRILMINMQKRRDINLGTEELVFQHKGTNETS
jgi:hypothetical protein